MLSLSPATRVYVALHPVDMRLGFNGLYALTQIVLSQEVLSGHLFVFTNKRRNRFAQTHRPEPSKYKIFTRFLSRLVNTNRWPLKGG